MVGGKQGHATCKILLIYKASFVLVELNGDHKTAYKDEVKSSHPRLCGYYRISNIGLSICHVGEVTVFNW